MSQAGPISSSSSSGMSNVDTLTGNTGGAVGPDGLDNINIVGTGAVIVTGNAGTNTLTISVTGTSVTETLTPDSGGAVNPVANNIDVNGIGGNTTLNGGSGILQIDNEYWLSPYVVDSNVTPGSRASYSTIQSAINAANTAGGGVVYVRPGNYTENLTLQPAVNLVATSVVAQVSLLAPFNGSVVFGNHTLSGAGEMSVAGMVFEAASGVILTTSSSSSPLQINLNDCTFTNSSGTCISSSASGGGSTQHNIDNCTFNSSVTTSACIQLGASAFVQMSDCTVNSDNGDGIALTAPLSFFRNGIINAGNGSSVVINGASGPPEPILDLFYSLVIGQVCFTFNANGLVGCGFNALVSFDGGGNYAIGGTGSIENNFNIYPYNNTLAAGITDLPIVGRARATAGTSGTAFAGVASFDSTDFMVTDGFVTFTGSATPGPYAVTLVNNGASPYTVLLTDQYLRTDCSGGVVSLLFPNAPPTGQYWIIKDSTGNSALNNITVTTVSGLVLFDGATPYTMKTNYESISILFDGTNYEVF